MISAKFNDDKFFRDMKNLMDYSVGYLDGIEAGKKVFINNLGKSVIEAMKEFVDANARVNPAALQHMYEWYQTGSPGARLFDLNYSVLGSTGLSFNSEFKQSVSIKNGSNSPFYNKARIMEEGIPVVIKPKRSGVLAFESNGETVFTKSPVRVENPGGDQAKGSYENTLNIFINQYFSQSWLISSGIGDYIKTNKSFKKNLPAGVKMGRAKGIPVGYAFITGAKVDN